MRVIFIEDVPDVARAGDTKVVADGYGRNYLLPKKLAVLANSAASNIVEAQLKKVAVKRAQAEAEMSELAKIIQGTEITLKAKVGEKGRLYGSITSADIAGEISSHAGADIDKRKIELEDPIRELGDYDITIRFTHDITAVIKVKVEDDKVAEEAEEKEEKKEKPKAEKKSRKKAEPKAEATEEKTDEVEAAEGKAEETAEEAAEKQEEETEPGE